VACRGGGGLSVGNEQQARIHISPRTLGWASDCRLGTRTQIPAKIFGVGKRQQKVKNGLGRHRYLVLVTDKLQTASNIETNGREMG